VTDIELLTEISLKLSDLYILGSISAGAILFSLGWIAGHQR
jgi:hypothetical protein